MTAEEQKKPQSVYRQQAIDFHIKSHHSEDPLQVMSYKGWLTKFSIAILVVLGLSWLFFGSILIETSGIAVAFSSTGQYPVEVSMTGVVDDLKVQVGEKIKKDQLIATMGNPELRAQLRAINAALTSLSGQYKHLVDEVKGEDQKRITALNASIEAKKHKISMLEKDIPIIEEDLRLKENLAKKGLLSSITMEKAKDLLWTKQLDLENTKSELYKDQFELKKEYRQQEIITLEELLRQQTKNKEITESQLQYDKIYSPINGTLLEWLVQPGSHLKTGELIAWLDAGEGKEGIVFYGYVPIEMRKIPKGARVEIELTSVNPQEYGALVGKVIQVNEKPITPELLSLSIHNKALIEQLLQKHSAIIEILIEPQKDPNTPSGYKWTSGKGPAIDLTTGTIAKFKAIVDVESPFNYYFSPWKIIKFFKSEK